MLKRITTNALGAVALAAVLAGLTVVLTTVAPQASAEPQITAAGPAAKANRLGARITGAACSSAAWPNYDRNCQFDRRQAADNVPTVRIIALR
jgi:hypothetical protein